MKKSLLLVAALAAGMSVNAQESYYLEVGAQLDGDGTLQAAGTEIGGGDVVTCYFYGEDTYKSASCNGPKTSDESASYRAVVFDNDVTMSETDVTDQGFDNGAITASNNPKDIDGSSPSGSFNVPVTGCCYQFVPNADGYLYCVGKFSTNKSYTAFEEGSCLAYELSMAFADQTVLSYDLYDYGDEYGYLSLSDFSSGMQSLETICSDLGASSNSGVGYIAFPVYADMSYVVNANGSKWTCLGYYYCTEKPSSIILQTDDGTSQIVLYSSDGSTGITNVSLTTSEDDENAPIYNLAGQRVTKDYKGVLIQNGKKFMNK